MHIIYSYIVKQILLKSQVYLLIGISTYVLINYHILNKALSIIKISIFVLSDKIYLLYS